MSYIEMAFPVASQTVTKNFSFGLSPATIRNIMGELDEMGYLTQPHTSAGRIPTAKAYHIYIEDLKEGDLPTLFEEDFLEEHYLRADWEDLPTLMKETTRMLSLISHYAGVVTPPQVSKTRLDRFEFILIRKSVVLAVLVSRDGVMKHRMIEADASLTPSDLSRIGHYLNERFSGRTLEEVRNQLELELNAEREEINRLMKTAHLLGRRALAAGSREDLYVEGASNVLDLPDFSNAEKMKELYRTFEEKAAILELLNNCIGTEGVQILIGSELDRLGIQDCSLVVSRYRGESGAMGSLGVLGPARMEYARVIPLVDQAAKLLGRLLDRYESEGELDRG